MFDDPFEFYEAIGRELAKLAPKGWRSAEVEALLVGESSIDLKVVYKKSFGRRIGFVDVEMLPRYFFELARVVSTEEKGLYKKCLFSMSRDGTFDVSYEY